MHVTSRVIEAMQESKGVSGDRRFDDFYTFDYPKLVAALRLTKATTPWRERRSTKHAPARGSACAGVTRSTCWPRGSASSP